MSICSAGYCFCRIQRQERRPSYSEWLPSPCWKTCRASGTLSSRVTTTINPVLTSNDRGRWFPNGPDLAGLRLHDLQHSFASVGAGSGFGLPVIGKLLGHSNSRTTEPYTHLAADPLRRASDAISGSIAKAMGEPAPSEPGLAARRRYLEAFRPEMDFVKSPRWSKAEADLWLRFA